MEKTAVQRHRFVGTVVSDATDKTIVVSVTHKIAHKRYKKVITRSKKYHVHDVRNEAKVGQKVQFELCKPISKLKRYRLVEVLPS